MDDAGFLLRSGLEGKASVVEGPSKLNKDHEGMLSVGVCANLMLRRKDAGGVRSDADYAEKWVGRKSRLLLKDY